MTQMQSLQRQLESLARKERLFKKATKPRVSQIGSHMLGKALRNAAVKTSYASVRTAVLSFSKQITTPSMLTAQVGPT